MDKKYFIKECHTSMLMEKNEFKIFSLQGNEFIMNVMGNNYAKK